MFESAPPRVLNKNIEQSDKVEDAQEQLDGIFQKNDLSEEAVANVVRNDVQEAPAAHNEQVEFEPAYPRRELKGPTWSTINALTTARDEDEPTVKVSLQSDDSTK